MADTVIVSPSLDSSRQRLISWTAIFSGWLVALGFAWLFYVMGIAVGFSAFDINAPEAVAKGIGIGTTVWVVLTWAVSLFLGGMFASWVDARRNSTVGALHGVAVWGLASSMTLLLAAAGFNNLLQGAAGLLRTGAVAGATAAGAAAGANSGSSETPLSRASGLLGAQVTRAITRANTGQGGAASSAPTSPATTTAVPAPASGGSDPRSTAVLSREASSAVAVDLLRGRNDDAKARLLAESGLQPAEVDAAIQGLSAQVENQKAQVKEAAEQARRYSAAALWAVVLSTLIGLIGAAIGGSLGAEQVGRLHPDCRLS